MRMAMAGVLVALVMSACGAERREKAPSATTGTSTAVTTATAATATPATTTPATSSAADSAGNPDEQTGTWAGQIAAGQPVSALNYVGAESGDFVPFRFRSDSEVGKKILAVCGDGDMCEITGAVVLLDEAPPQDASAVGEIVRVDLVRRVAADGR